MNATVQAYGGAAPDGLAEDLAELGSLSSDGRARFWEILSPALVADPLPKELERKIDVFCAELGLAPQALARSLRAARSFVRAAVRRGLDKTALEADLATLAAPDEARDVVLAGYEQAFAALRRQAAIEDIAAHGKLLTGVDWRVDRILDTKRVKRLGVDVLVLTLRFKEGGAERSITLQVLPDMLGELRDVGTSH